MIAIPRRPLSLFEELADAGITLAIGPAGQIEIDAPAGVLTTELIDRIRLEKAEILQLLQCARCGSTQFIETLIHAGCSTRRDCSECRRTFGFSRWHRSKQT